MAQDHYREFISKKHVLISVVLSLIFWVAFTRMLLPFVPAQSLTWQYIWSGFTALCMTGVFYVAVHMFMLVAGAQRSTR